MLNKNLLITTIIILILSPLNVNAVVDEGVEQNMNFKNITTENGLSHSTANVLFQDSDGYIWIGTNDGLNRYNGFEMEAYKNQDDEENTIINNFILSIKEDKDRNLWVGTNRGISKINLDTNEITNFKEDDNGDIYYNVKNILITKKGTVIIVTPKNVYQYNKAKGKLDKIEISSKNLKNEKIQAVCEDDNGNLWLGGNKSILKVDMKTRAERKYISKESKYFNRDENSIYNNKINSILIDDKDRIWVSTKNNGLKVLELDKNENAKVTSYYNDKNDIHSIPSNNTNSMIQDKAGNIWIGTDKGICKYLGRGKFTTYSHKFYDENSLINNNVYSLMEDRNGLIWIGTYTGVSVFDSDSRIKKYKNNPLDENSISDDVIHGIYEDEDGYLWIGTKDKGVNVVDRNNNRIKRLNASNTKYGITDNSISSIAGAEDTIWIGTSYGLNKVDRNNMTVKKYTMNEGLVSNNIRTLLLDSKGYLWIITSDGINLLNTKNNKIINITKYLEGLGIGETYIEAIYEDEEGIYWLGNFLSGSLIRLDSNNDDIQLYEILDSETHQKVSSIKCIAGDNNRYLWIGTSDGLVRFDKIRHDFKLYTERDGLPSNIICGVLLDNENNPWASTNNGISKLDLQTNKFTNLNLIDGLQSNAFNERASYKTKNGEFIFGGINGLNIFRAEDIEKNIYSPEIVFESFDVNGRLYKNISDKEFKYSENFFRIKFFVPDYSLNHIKFYYKLEGLNNEWRSVNTNEIVFNKLAPGSYKLQVRARGQNGEFGEASEVSFTIKPPIWKSEPAILLYILLLIFVIRNVKRKVNHLDRLVDIRTMELSREMKRNSKLLNQVIVSERSKNNYFINLSHELRTPLNVISSVEQLITNLNKTEQGISSHKLDEYMIVMNKNIKRLLNLINNIIDTTKIENGKYKINVKNENIVYIVEEAALSLKQAIESSGIELIIDTDVEEKFIECDRHEIERCIVNLLSNASKFTPSGGTIKVDIKDLDDVVKIVVEDTGIGIDKKYHRSIFDRFNQVVDENTEAKGGSGLGLTITKHIIDMHNGEIYVESEKNMGTKFTILLFENANFDKKILI